MPGKYRAYPEYKDSGVEWFGSVPEHWLKTRLKFSAAINMGQSPTSEDCNQDGIGLPFLQGNAEFTKLYPMPKSFCEIPRKIASSGDLLFSVRAPVGALNIADQTYGIGRGLCAIKVSNNLVGQYLWWLIPVIRSELDSVSTGSTFDAVSAEEVQNVTFCQPSKAEQQKIANFLDHETAKIDTLIEKQQQLIQLLKEKRQAVISHAVTKGLNPNAPMRDSGVEWLGEVPKHWEVKRLRFIADVQSGVAKGKDNSGLETIEVPYLRVANVQDGFLDLETVTTIEIPSSSLERYLLRVGDVLMNEGGDFDKLGRGHVWNGEIEPCIHQNHVFAIRPKAVSSEWLNEITGSHYAQFYFMTRSKQSTNLASISSTNIMELPVVLPPTVEQQQILKTVSDKRTQFDALTAKAQHAIGLLKERRTALISAAVTGKIDVRHWKVSLNEANMEIMETAL
jgi:type I restriction enzyme S subunit